MRIVLFTGKGGVGKTTVAAATALRCAAERVCARSWCRPIRRTRSPTSSTFRSTTARRRVAPRLWGQQLNARVRFEEAWDDVRAYMVDVLDWVGADSRRGRRARRRARARRGVLARRHQEFATQRATTTSWWSTARPPPRRSGCSRCPTCSAGTWTELFERQRRSTRLARPLLQRVPSLPVAGDQVFGAHRPLLRAARRRARAA